MRGCNTRLCVCIVFALDFSGLALYELDRFEASIVDLKASLEYHPPKDIIADM